VVRATKGAAVRDFVSLAELNAWAATDEAKTWRLKYYKGLGTWNNSDAKKLLASTKPVAFVDGEGTEEAMKVRKHSPQCQHVSHRLAWPLVVSAPARAPFLTTTDTGDSSPLMPSWPTRARSGSWPTWRRRRCLTTPRT